MSLLQMILEETKVSLFNVNETRDKSVGYLQFVKFNVISRKCEQSALHLRHKNFQETPLTVYIGLNIHSKTHKKSMVNKFSLLGLYILFNRVNKNLSGITQNVCQ